MKSHKDLLVYQKALDLVTVVYAITKMFPKEEQFGLTSQLRRASISIPSNISEGAGRKSKKEFIQFLFIALGSLNEVETQLEISKRLDYLQDLEKINNDLIHIKRMLLKLIESLKEN